MLKRYRKNDTEVEAIQYDGTEESLNEIKEQWPELGERVVPSEKDHPMYRTFSMICKNGHKTIFETDWIVKDTYHFVVSNDIFTEMFTEIKE